MLDFGSGYCLRTHIMKYMTKLQTLRLFPVQNCVNAVVFICQSVLMKLSCWARPLFTIAAVLSMSDGNPDVSPATAVSISPWEAW